MALAGFGLVKSKKLTTNTVAEFAKTVPSIQSICLSQDDEIIEPLFLRVTPYIQGTLDTHYVKRSFNSTEVCFLEFYRSSNAH